MDEEVDRIMFLRQRTTPRTLVYLPDRLFYRYIPDPEDRGTGTPRFYRQWEETGFLTSLAANDTIEVLSSSGSDGSGFSVRIVGRNTDGVVIHETLTLNGTTAVVSATTFASGSLMRVSKSANTTGIITVRRTTGATVLIRIASTEASPRSKIISLFPIPSSVITVYLEYLERLHYLVSDVDVPQHDPQWNWVLQEGALQHLWMYKQNPLLASASKLAFVRGLGLMKQADGPVLHDYVSVLEPRLGLPLSTIVRDRDSVNGEFPAYSLRY